LAGAELADAGAADAEGLAGAEAAPAVDAEGDADGDEAVPPHATSSAPAASAPPSLAANRKVADLRARKAGRFNNGKPPEERIVKSRLARIVERIADPGRRLGARCRKRPAGVQLRTTK